MNEVYVSMPGSFLGPVRACTVIMCIGLNNLRSHKPRCSLERVCAIVETSLDEIERDQCKGVEERKIGRR